MVYKIVRRVSLSWQALNGKMSKLIAEACPVSGELVAAANATAALLPAPAAMAAAAFFGSAQTH
jgi:hypothetical protein